MTIEGIKKKAKSRKGLPKTFACTVAGCNKAFTRMEHLSRHNLNRKCLQQNRLKRRTNSILDDPKEIYFCNVESCRRTFVRMDLYRRHMEKHKSRSLSTSQSSTNMTTEPGYHASPGSDINDPNNLRLSTLADISVLPEHNSSPVSQVETRHTELWQDHSDSNMHDQDQSLPIMSTGIIDQTMTGTSPDSADVVEWLLSSGFLAGNWRTAPMDQNSYLLSPTRDFSEISSSPSFIQTMIMSEAKREEMILQIPSLASFDEFSLENVQRYNELYWDHFHFQFPIMHRPSFQIETKPLYPLLFSILLVGSSYADVSEEFRSAIAGPLRWVIFSSCHFHPPTRVWRYRVCCY